jgi:DNA replication protein DnaC
MARQSHTALKDYPMMMNNTLAQLRELKLVGMASAVEEQLSSSASTALCFEERLALMVDREVNYRGDKRRAALLNKAGLKYAQACIEDVDGRAGRGFERSAMMSLALSRWVEDGTPILVTGPTGSGKSWLACALAQYACRRGHSALYLRTPRLAEELRILHGNGGFSRWLAAVARTDVLVLDDWGLAALDGPTRSDLMEVIDDRAGTRSTIVTSQLPVEHWHAWIGDATVADAILDRLLSRSHRLVLKGESMRPRKAASAAIAPTADSTPIKPSAATGKSR